MQFIQEEGFAGLGRFGYNPTKAAALLGETLAQGNVFAMLMLGELLLDRDDNDAAMRMFIRACLASDGRQPNVLARQSFTEHLIATKALRCTAAAWILIVAQCSAIP